ncbi:hypothetical protein WBS51_07020 [Blautia sp. HA2174]|uniref:hypothetical protein n=1 Tax=unclassified Blautia TaxID=2648079 RepID=UPI002045037B|nr:hypothetical protein [uncultured Blautia sp.]DAJ73934.1 MAG TPA: hypothetical protein [Caudoviricetes sp.]
MAIELVTAYKGKDHVTAEQWADFNRGIYGDAAILPVGNKMETAIQTANQITVKDGVAVIDGRQVYIGYGESENIAIQSGTQGKLRRDIVVLEYKKEEVSGVETIQFKVITGTPADSDAKDPSVQDMDIRTGVFTSQKPFCRVRLNGTAIEGVDTLIPVKEFKPHAFAAPVNNLAGTNPDLALAAPQGRELKKQVDALNSALMNKIVLGSDKNTTLIVTDQTLKFVGGAATVNLNTISSAYQKTAGDVIAQLKSASAAVITSANVSKNIATIKCSNLSGTPYEGEIAITLLIFMS